MVKVRRCVLMGILAGTLVSCGGNKVTATSPAGQAGKPTISRITPISMPTAAGSFGTRPPKITVGTGPPPAVLQASDLITGTGRAAETGDTLTIQYVEASYSAPGTVVQTTWDQMPFSFTIGGGQVIKGWDEGVVGMKVGGRRELIIPPKLAFNGISEATVVLVVDLLRFGAPPTTTTVPKPETQVETTHLGGTLALTATQQMSTGLNVLTGPNPPVTTTVVLNITLDQVIDPAPSSLNAGAPTPGDRWVELKFTVANVGTVAFTDQQEPYYPSLTFEVDNASNLNELGAQPMPTLGYSSASIGAGSCGDFLTISPGATATGCVGFQPPVGVPIVIASVSLNLSDSPSGSLGQWLIP